MTLAHRISAWNRRRKWAYFLKELAPDAQTRVLDVGFSEIEYSPNDNFIEKNYPYPEKLTALGVDNPKEFLVRYPKVQALQYDGKTFPFKDKEFDICWSNAVIEHVGDKDAQLFFLKEIARVSKRAIVTTPNKYFPVEVHTRTPMLHFLPLSKGDLKELLAQAGISDYTIKPNRIMGFGLDFVLTFPGVKS